MRERLRSQEDLADPAWDLVDPVLHWLCLMWERADRVWERADRVWERADRVWERADQV